MFWFFKVKNAIVWTRRCAQNEAYALKTGFGRLEKARCLGRLEAYENVLHWLGIHDTELEEFRKSFKLN